MNDRKKAEKYDELLKKSKEGEEVLDIEGQRWLRMHPEMENWAESHAEIVEWMTDAMKFPPRSDCG